MITDTERILQMCDDFENYKKSHDDTKEFQQKFYQEFINHCETEAERSVMILQKIESLDESTKDVVKLHRDIQGAASVGMTVQKFIVWVGKFGAIGVGLAWLVQALSDYFCKHPPRGG
jgi:hypothetical protein